MLKQIVDGFSYNPNLLYHPTRYWPHALAQLDPLRRAKNYRPRWMIAPRFGESIAAYDVAFTQFQIDEKSIFWGYNFSVVSGVSTALFALKLVDSCTGQSLFQDYVNGNGLTCGIGGGSSTSASKCVPILLSQPRTIVGSGKIDVAIANLTNAAQTVQWLLHFAEPCAMIDEKTGKVVTGVK